MSRIRVKGNGSKAASSPATEPNFYVMEPCPGQDDDTDTLSSPPGISSNCFIEDEEGMNDLETKDFAIIRDDEFDDEERFHSGIPLTIAYENDDHDSFIERSFTPVSGSLPVSPIVDDVEEEDEKRAFTMKFSNLPPIVSPIQPRKRKLLSHPFSPCQVPSNASLEDIHHMDIEGEFHSGDQLFFEGLPFHYLEAKDIEEALVDASRQYCLEKGTLSSLRVN